MGTCPNVEEGAAKRHGQMTTAPSRVKIPVDASKDAALLRGGLLKGGQGGGDRPTQFLVL